MAEMIGLGVPAGRQVGGERGMDEPGDGRGMRAAGIPLQGEWDELRWLDRPDYGRGVRLGRGRNEQDPADVALLLAAAIHTLTVPAAIGDLPGHASGEADCSAAPNSACVSCPFFRGQGRVSLAPQPRSPAS